jgi:hypothetical protein
VALRKSATSGAQRNPPRAYSEFAMRHLQINAKSILKFLALAVSSLPLYAAEPIAADWNQVCRVAGRHELLVTTTAGNTLEGFCVGVSVTEISVRTKNIGIVKIARNTLSRLEMRRAKGHQLKTLGEGMSGSLRWGFDALLSPLGPVAVVSIPGTLAWGAVAAPFCVLGDLKARVAGTREIKPN